MKRYALIVAGGSGSRMKSATPKQFIPIGGLPVLMHTINAFHKTNSEIEIILVLPETEFDHWSELKSKYSFSIKHALIAGGKTRFESVRNGLFSLKGDGLVAIHDGVRPFASNTLINQCYLSAKSTGSGIAAVLPKDSIRVLNDLGNASVDRNDYRLIQTPQTFVLSKIKEAFLEEDGIMATDDATVAEKFGIKITLVEGEYTNLKITTPEDIAIAQALIDERGT